MLVARIAVPWMLLLGASVALVVLRLWMRVFLKPCKHCPHSRFAHSAFGCHRCRDDSALHTFERG
jgi:hypothetical protein